MQFRWLPLVLVILVARAVQAAEPLDASIAESPVSEPSEWYGWQTALVDVASLGLGAAVAGLSGNNRSGGVSGNIAGGLAISGFVLGGPAVHAAHGHWNKAGASLGLRLGTPVAGALGGALVGAASCPHDDSDVPCPVVGAAIGMIAGVAAAIIVDATVIAYEPQPKAGLGLQVTPVVIAERNRWGVGFGGTF